MSRDVKLFHTNDNGDIEIENGVMTMSSGLDTAAYLSLFGGNWKDDGSQNTTQQWWGNKFETEQANQYRSETQYLLGLLPATSGNLLKIEQAVLRDLQWLLDEKAASTVEASVALAGLNLVTISVTIEAIGEEAQFEFTENWRAAA